MNDYETTLHRMISEYEFHGKCTVEEGSDMQLKFKIVADELALLYDKLADYEKQIFPNTAQGIYLDKHGAAKGLIRKSAVKSTGIVTFTARTPVTNTINIPAGTLLACSNADDVTFVTTENAKIQAPSASIAVPIESVSTGKNTIIAPQMIDILITPIAGISHVSNPSKIDGGTDGEPDQVYRKRVLDSYTRPSNGCNLKYYEQLACAVDGVWYAKAYFTDSTPAKIEICIENYTRTITDELIAQVQNIVKTKREVGIEVIVKRAVKKPINFSITIAVDTLVNVSTVKTLCSDAFTEFVLNCGVNESFCPSKLIADLLSIGGVKRITALNPSSHVTTSNWEIPTPGTFTSSWSTEFSEV